MPQTSHATLVDQLSKAKKMQSFLVFCLAASFLSEVSGRTRARTTSNVVGRSVHGHPSSRSGTGNFSGVLTDDLLFFFFFVPPGRPGYELPFANKQCYLAAHNYSMLLEVKPRLRFQRYAFVLQFTILTTGQHAHATLTEEIPLLDRSWLLTTRPKCAQGPPG